MTGTSQKPQWEQVADAVAALGGKATRAEVWEYLKRSLPDIPFSTVSAELNAVAVNAPARTSYHAGSQPRRTDMGNRYDRLFKVGSGSGAYYEVYDPEVQGVWEIYADPSSTSTHKTSIRPVGATTAALTVALSDGAVKPGNTFFPVQALDNGFFPESMIRAKNPDAPAVPAHFTTDAGTSFQSDIYRGTNTGYLHNRSAASAYYQAKGAKGGDSLRYEKLGEGEYRIVHVAAASAGDTSDASYAKETNPEDQRPMSINRILFGPPGTGKTYNTINQALRILDPDFLDEFFDERETLKHRFDELAQAGLIRFVTFHQSFSYEDFVEGIRASTDETSGRLRYEVEDGVFKQICEAARSRTVAAETGSGVSISGRKVWKLSLGDANSEQHVFDECMEKGIALMGFGFGADLTGVSSRQEIFERVRAAEPATKSTDYAITALDQFVRRVQEGDLVVVTHGNLKFRAIGEVTGPYRYMGQGEDEHYVQARPVRWLRQYDPPRPYGDLMENRFSQMTIYELRSGSINLDRLAALLSPETENQIRRHEPEARVLIIDEINRGNISRIFGELITLLEPSKRAGAPEALEVTLPYSKERFSVPANVHLIGTMNTADRSLAGLDVALRRRFEFVEMLPDVEALGGVKVEGVPLDALLDTMNRRIEVLLGRDYMLGHAYFMGLKETPTLEALAGVFRRQVLPLLQEYFFEDWQKIAWVLNDHRKPEALRFVRQVNLGVAELLGDEVELPGEGRLWRINNDAFDLPEAYRAVIKAPQAAA